MIYKTKGIVIKRTNLGEADRILTIFTENRGKIKVVAKGVRKTLSKLGGHLEPFCLVNLCLAEGRNLDVVTGVEMMKCFFRLRGNLTSTNTACYIGEVVEKMTAENEVHPEIFELLLEVVEHLNKGQEKLLLAYFEINFLSESGFRPELYKCLVCGQKLTSKNNHFSFSAAGVVCEKCANSDIEISDKAIKVLRLFLRHKISVISKINAHKKLASEIEKISGLYLEHIAQKEFKSKRFLEAGEG